MKQYQDTIALLPGLDLMPPQWLHLTLQGIGFMDEISAADLAAVTRNVERRLSGLRPPAATFHRPTIRPEAVILKADPPEPLYQLRVAVHDAIASVLDPATFREPRPEPGRFTPHVSIAYVNSDGPAQPIADSLASTDFQPVAVTFDSVSLLVFHRDRRMYEWTQAVPLPIGLG